jgi:hypothetical protein
VGTTFSPSVLLPHRKSQVPIIRLLASQREISALHMKIVLPHCWTTKHEPSKETYGFDKEIKLFLRALGTQVPLQNRKTRSNTPQPDRAIGDAGQLTEGKLKRWGLDFGKQHAERTGGESRCATDSQPSIPNNDESATTELIYGHPSTNTCLHHFLAIHLPASSNLASSIQRPLLALDK